MKKYLVKILMLLAVAVSFSAAIEAQFVVKIRPAVPVIRVRPLCPTPRHIWVAGEYVYVGNNYVYKEGYWALPPQPGFRWVEGHWKATRRGWRWIHGHWR